MEQKWKKWLVNINVIVSEYSGKSSYGNNNSSFNSRSSSNIRRQCSWL